ncbi:hypothetical protein HN587_06255 [Candidatus Woesearchaeota archaeon]|jgi:hypothetical protein|nr:hypothetical protein [Candidatus Woesearchaeota archaeon]
MKTKKKELKQKELISIKQSFDLLKTEKVLKLILFDILTIFSFFLIIATFLIISSLAWVDVMKINELAKGVYELGEGELQNIAGDLEKTKELKENVTTIQKLFNTFILKLIGITLLCITLFSILYSASQYFGWKKINIPNTKLNYKFLKFWSMNLSFMILSFITTTGLFLLLRKKPILTIVIIIITNIIINYVYKIYSQLIKENKSIRIQIKKLIITIINLKTLFVYFVVVLVLISSLAILGVVSYFAAILSIPLTILFLFCLSWNKIYYAENLKIILKTNKPHKIIDNNNTKNKPVKKKLIKKKSNKKKTRK